MCPLVIVIEMNSAYIERIRPLHVIITESERCFVDDEFKLNTFTPVGVCNVLSVLYLFANFIRSALLQLAQLRQSALRHRPWLVHTNH